MNDIHSPSPVGPSTPTAYVPGHEYDVFVSYARRTNEDGKLDDQYGWVTRFYFHLNRILNERCPGVRVFFDDVSIAGNVDLDEKVVTAVQSSAMLVVVLSPVYLSREYCKKERDLFCSSIGGEQAAIPRTLLVHHHDVPLNERPTFLTRPKGYTFFRTDPLKPHLQRPLEDTSEKLKDEYKDCLYDLCGEIVGKLKELKQDHAATQARLKAAATGSPVVDDRSAPVIFLAEATPDLRGRQDRRCVETAMRQAGFRILPEAGYGRNDLTAYQQSLDKDLQRSMLFVQVLGDSGSEESQLPYGFEGLQFARAKAAGKPCLRWRPRDLDLNAIREFMANYHRYLTDEDAEFVADLQADERVQAGFLADFMQTIEETARKVLARQVRSGSKQPAGSRVVLISPQRVDENLAQQFGRQASAAVISDLADESYPLPDVYENEAGLVVVYGQSPYDTWVKDRVKECRQIALDHASRPPICAIYIGPPDSKPPLPKRPANFHVIHHEDQAAMAAYLAEVTAKGVVP